LFAVCSRKSLKVERPVQRLKLLFYLIRGRWHLGIKIEGWRSQHGGSSRKTLGTVSVGDQRTLIADVGLAEIPHYTATIAFGLCFQLCK
jgi:hypothetical protein